MLTKDSLITHPVLPPDVEYLVCKIMTSGGLPLLVKSGIRKKKIPGKKIGFLFLCL